TFKRFIMKIFGLLPPRLLCCLKFNPKSERGKVKITDRLKVSVFLQGMVQAGGGGAKLKSAGI
ncbi:MAG: hypothetical protein ACUVWV_15290, partial [Thermodesulfobacteriota bacterium]